MLQYIYQSHIHDARTLTQIKGQVIQKRLTLSHRLLKHTQ